MCVPPQQCEVAAAEGEAFVGVGGGVRVDAERHGEAEDELVEAVFVDAESGGEAAQVRFGGGVGGCRDRRVGEHGGVLRVWAADTDEAGWVELSVEESDGEPGERRWGGHAGHVAFLGQRQDADDGIDGQQRPEPDELLDAGVELPGEAVGGRDESDGAGGDVGCGARCGGCCEDQVQFPDPPSGGSPEAHEAVQSVQRGRGWPRRCSRCRSERWRSSACRP